MLNVSIPAQQGDGPYKHTFDLNQAVGQQFVATMYDSTGWGAGGVSGIQSELLLRAGLACHRPY